MTTTPPPQPPAYGRLIEGAREAQGIPQRAAARRAGIGRQTWVDAARGYKLRDRQAEPVSPEPRTIARMAHAVGVAPERLESEGEHPGAAEILREILRSREQPPPELSVLPLPRPDGFPPGEDDLLRTVLKAPLRVQEAVQAILDLLDDEGEPVPWEELRPLIVRLLWLSAGGGSADEGLRGSLKHAKSLKPDAISHDGVTVT